MQCTPSKLFLARVGEGCYNGIWRYEIKKIRTWSINHIGPLMSQVMTFFFLLYLAPAEPYTCEAQLFTHHSTYNKLTKPLHFRVLVNGKQTPIHTTKLCTEDISKISSFNCILKLYIWKNIKIKQNVVFRTTASNNKGMSV